MVKELIINIKQEEPTQPPMEQRHSKKIVIDEAFKKKNKMKLQRREHIHLKHFLQHTTNVEALVERKFAFATAIILIYPEKNKIQWKLLETLKSQPYF